MSLSRSLLHSFVNSSYSILVARIWPCCSTATVETHTHRKRERKWERVPAWSQTRAELRKQPGFTSSHSAYIPTPPCPTLLLIQFPLNISLHIHIRCGICLFPLCIVKIIAVRNWWYPKRAPYNCYHVLHSLIIDLCRNNPFRSHFSSSFRCPPLP